MHPFSLLCLNRCELVASGRTACIGGENDWESDESFSRWLHCILVYWGDCWQKNESLCLHHGFAVLISNIIAKQNEAVALWLQETHGMFTSDVFCCQTPFKLKGLYRSHCFCFISYLPARMSNIYSQTAQWKVHLQFFSVNFPLKFWTIWRPLLILFSRMESSVFFWDIYIWLLGGKASAEQTALWNETG